MKRREDFQIGPKERLVGAIKSGNKEDALQYANELYEMFRSMHDGFVNSISLMHGKLAEANGEEWLEGFTRDRMSRWKTVFQAMKDMTPEERVRMICDIQRAMYSQFHVDEDEKKFVISITGCNNGGRLIRDGIAKKQNALTKNAYPWCFNKVGVPHYCIHAAIWAEIFKALELPIEVEWGRQYDDEGKPVDEPCKYIIYK
jgi:hypothetical protein